MNRIFNRFTLSLIISICIHVIFLFFYLTLSKSENKERELVPLSFRTLPFVPSNIESKNIESKNSLQKQNKIKKAQSKQNKIKEAQSTKNTNANNIKLESSEKLEVGTKTIGDSINENNSENINYENIKTTNTPNLLKNIPNLQEQLKKDLDDVEINKLPSVIKNFLLDIYGHSFNYLNKEEKDYLARNYMLNVRIFQHNADILGYPNIAARFNLEGQPIVEFTLFPDGNISDIIYIRESKINSIDESIKKIIELSIKDLARPNTPIRIRLQGNYFIVK